MLSLGQVFQKNYFFSYKLEPRGFLLEFLIKSKF